MRNIKIASLVIFSVVVVVFGVVFYNFIGREMFANKFISDAVNAQTYEQAIQSYQIALKLSPKSATARNSLIDIYLENDNYEQAYEQIEIGMSQNPDNDNLYFYKIKMLEQFSKIDEAIEVVENIESSYVKSKFSTKANIEPSYSLESGNYSTNIELQLSTSNPANIYYKINAGKYQLYTEPVELLDGFYTIKTVAINEQGVISRVVEAEYFVEILAAPVSFTTSQTIISIETQIGQDATINKEGLLKLIDIDLSESTLFDPDIETLLNCQNLQTLKLGDVSNVTNFNALSKLKNLESIYIKSGCTADLYAELVKMPSIKEIEIYNSKINVLPKNEITLKKLALINCLIYDIDKIDSYKTLENLDLSYNSIREVDKLQNLKKLDELNLSNNQISDISSIFESISIKKLDVSFNDITSIKNLSNMLFLESVNISSNNIASVLEFSNLRYLKYLDCSYNNILTLEPLVSNDSIIEIYANGNFISDISYISDMKNLQYINLRDNASS